MEKTNAALIRDLGNKFGFYHTNTWFVDKLEKPPYHRYVTCQQVQHTCGRLADRRDLGAEKELQRSCKKFLRDCHYDEPLAKRLMRNVLHEQGRR